MDTLQRDLEIPEPFARLEHQEKDTIDLLEHWKNGTTSTLLQVHALLKREQAERKLPLQDWAKTVFLVSPFDANEPWVIESARLVAADILAALPHPTLEVVQYILTNHVKPLFAASPHPSINVATGRGRSRPTGGPDSKQDFFIDQLWKQHPGLSLVVLWCASHVESEDYEQLWHLLIPPTMTLLDDYETQYKVHGVMIVDVMLRRAPGDLLRRTGIDGLLNNSLSATLLHLHNTDTAKLLRLSVPTYLTLIDKTTSPTSKARFDRLFKLLGEGIIGGVWVYASRDAETIEASIGVLPGILDALGICSVRFLKALVPQLVYPLIPVPHARKANASLQIASLDALLSVIAICQPRISTWKGVILDGVCRCWATIASSVEDSHDQAAIKARLHDVCNAIELACPTVRQDEYSRLLEVQPDIFEDLFSPVKNATA